MPEKKKKLEVKFDTREEKKHSVRFDCNAEDAAVRSLYVSKKALEVLGNPKLVKITIEEA